MKLSSKISFFIFLTTYLVMSVSGDDEEQGQGKGNGNSDYTRIEESENRKRVQNKVNSGSQVTVKRKYDSCASTHKKHVECEKITNEQMLNYTDNSCTQEACSPTNLTYTVTVNGEKITTLIEYSIRRAIYINGNLNYFYWGKVLSGYLRGAFVDDVGYFPNNDPNACSSTNGLTELYSAFLTITFKKNDLEICCKGMASITFSPGLMNNS